MTEKRLHVGQRVIILTEIKTNHGLQKYVKGVVEGIQANHYEVRPQYYKHFIKLTNEEVQPV